MDIPQTYLDNLKKRQKKTRGSRSERAEIIGAFVEGINREREGTQWKPVTPARVNMLVARRSVQELYRFMSACKQSDSFSKCFFGVLKNKKVV